jgi:hypothetical protein
MRKENAPGREAEGVECLLAGDIDAHSTKSLNLQQLPPLEQRQRKPTLSRKYTTEQIEACATERIIEWRAEWSLRRIREGRHESHRPISKAEADKRLNAALRLIEGETE